MPVTPSKAYIVVDKDLSSGAKQAQSGHALVELVRNEPEMAKAWNEGPNVLICLEADYGTMFRTLKNVEQSGARAYGFHEPDFDNALTAFAVFNEGDHVNVPLSALGLSQRKPAGKLTEWRRRKRETAMRGHAAGTESVTLALR